MTFDEILIRFEFLVVAVVVTVSGHNRIKISELSDGEVDNGQVGDYHKS